MQHLTHYTNKLITNIKGRPALALEMQAYKRGLLAGIIIGVALTAIAPYLNPF